MSGESGTSASRARSIGLGVIVAIAVVGALGTWAVSNELSSTPNASRAGAATKSSPTPTPTVTPAPAATPTADGKLDDAQSLAVVKAALTAPVAKVGTEVDLDELLKNVATGAYVAELQAQWQELNSQGWTISGSPKIVSSKVTALDTASATPTAQVTTCVDSSAVRILDSAGKPIGSPSAMTPRALNLFSLVQGEDHVWRISTHSFPNNPTC